MATPTIPIEIWAEGDIILPVTHDLNKERPIDDLWLKGWDEGEKPACEEFNYVLNMATWWLKYINGEQIPGLDSRFLRVSQNLADVPNKAAARTNLDVWSKAEADTQYVNVIGDTMTGPLVVPQVTFNAATTDSAYITTTVPSSDTTFFDFVLGDNPGALGATGVDSFRFRFVPTGNAAFTILELNALNNTTGQARVNGNIVATGTISGTTLSGTTGTFTNLTVSNSLSTGTISATTGTITNLTVSGTGSFGTMNANGSTIQNLSVPGTLSGNVVNANGSTIQNLTVPGKITTTNLQVNSGTTTGALTVSGQYAVIGGRNAVRAVNGIGADGNGNLSLPMPTQGVQDVRLGGLGSQGASNDFQVPGGCVVTGLIGWKVTGPNFQLNALYYRAVQKLLNGTWYTVGQL